MSQGPQNSRSFLSSAEAFKKSPENAFAEQKQLSVQIDTSRETFQSFF